jgi:hypothetical protein
VIATLAHDWPRYVAGGDGTPLLARPTTVRFVPPPYTTVPSFAGFVQTHQACIRARLDVGLIEPIDRAAATGEPGRPRPRSLNVLPASG